jgi:hypothetical protein
MIAEGKVLTSKGYYKYLKHIQTGDKVMNMYGKPVAIKNIVIRNCNDLTAIHHDAWHGSIIMPKHQTVLTWDNKIEKPVWRPVQFFEEIDDSHKHFPVPCNITFDHDKFLHSHLKPSYKLGYIFGLFLVCGKLLNAPQVQFEINMLNSHTHSKLYDIIMELFRDTLISISINKNNVVYNDLHLYNIFLSFGMNNKFLPEKYWCQEKNYTRGIVDGIKQFKDQNNLPHYVSEMSYWAILTAHGLFHKDQTIRKHLDTSFTIGNIQYIIDNVYDAPLYLLDVDCPSKSYIMSNIIVKNEFI